MAFKLAEAFVELKSQGFAAVNSAITSVGNSLSSLSPRLGGVATGFSGLISQMTAGFSGLAGTAAADIGSVGNAIGGLTPRLSGVASGFAGMAGGLASLLNPIGLAVGAVAGLTAGVAALGAGLLSIGTKAVLSAAEFETIEISFKVLLGSAEEAKSVLANLADFAATTPFELPEIATAAKSLLSFGVSADDLIPTLTMLGNISAGMGIPMNELSQIFGKAKVQGRLFMEDINQLTGRGINVIPQLAEQFGVAESAIRQMVTEGKVGFADLQEAMLSLSQNEFGGMIAEQSQTLTGLWSTFKDEIGGALREIGAILMEEFDLKGLLQTAIEVAKTIASWAPALGLVIDAVKGAWDWFLKIDAALGGVISMTLKWLGYIMEALDGVMQVMTQMGIAKEFAGKQGKTPEQQQRDFEEKVKREAEAKRNAGAPGSEEDKAKRKQDAEDAAVKRKADNRRKAEQEEDDAMWEAAEADRKAREKAAKEAAAQAERDRQADFRADMDAQIKAAQSGVDAKEAEMAKRSGNAFTGLTDFWKQIQMGANKPNDVEKKQLEAMKQAVEELKQIRAAGPAKAAFA